MVDWIGVCESCHKQVTGEACDEEVALVLLNEKHREKNQDCSGEILVAFDIRKLVSSGQR